MPFARIWLQAAGGALVLAAGVGCDRLCGDVLGRLDAAAIGVAASQASAVVAELGVPAGQADGSLPGTEQALLLPLDGEPGGAVRGVVAFGISSRLHFDDRYRQFLEQLAAQLSASLRLASALQELERRRNYLSELFMQAPAGIALLAGPEHTFELVNPVYRAMIGDRDVIGRPLRDALPELVGQPFGAILDQVFRTGAAYVGREVPAQLDFLGAGRQQALFTFLYQPMRDAQGTVTGILVMCYDVTAQVRERERAEALAMELQLEHRRKDEFLAMLAHELRNPLAPISSAAQVLRQGGLDAERQQWASQLIARQVDHMASLVADLLDVSRVTRGLVEIERKPVDLKSVVAEATEQVRPLLDARSHRFMVDLPPGTAFVVGDRARLVQVLANLLNNAAKYTPEGGTVSMAVTIDSTHAGLRVRDDGIGMAPELLPRVFDLFVQAERSEDRSQGGLGIGLALVKTLVALHGGTVVASSEGPGRGSEFVVRLPRMTELSAPTSDDRARQTGGKTVARTVLIVDDNVDAAEALGLLIESQGHKVIVAHEGAAALGAAAQRTFDVCLLDIGLPGMDGYEVARHLRQLPGAECALIVALTGYGQDDDKRRAAAAGFDRYIVKPLEFDQLAAIFGG